MDEPAIEDRIDQILSLTVREEMKLKAAQEQFNVDQYNAQVRYNQKLADARDKFNASARLQIDQSNILWRRNVNTINVVPIGQHEGLLIMLLLVILY